MRTALAAALLGVLLTSGCGDDPGPLTAGGDSFVGDPQPHGLWFTVRGCLRDDADDPADVMVTDLEPTRVQSADDVDLRVAWNPDPQDVGGIGNPGEPPDVFQPFTADHHTGGTLTDCSLMIAVVLRSNPREVVRVNGLDITYESDGHTYSTHAGVDVALCPPGTKPSTTAVDCS